MAKGTILGALQAIGATVEDVQNCETIEVEFRNLKRVYFKRILASHPDKGGDPNVFRDVQAAWEVVRELYDKGKVNPAGFPFYFSGKGAKQAAAAPATDYSAGPRPSYEYYEAAAQEDVPNYRVERAKSNRSECKAKLGALGTRHGPAGAPKPAKATGKGRGKGKAKAEAAEEARDESRALVDMSCAVIEKGAIRFGSMDLLAGAYGRWHHLQCTRIPSSIWLGLPPEGCTDPALFRAALERMTHVVLSGFSELDEEGKAEVVAYFMNRENYARLTKKSAPAVPYDPSPASAPAPATSAAAGAAAGASASPRPPAGPASGAPTGHPPSTSSSSSASAAPTAHQAPSQALTVSRPVNSNVFVVPRPGLNGAAAGALSGKTFVLTGVFPEVGGGAGLNLGKDRVEAMIEAFGGRVTGSVSGKTSALVVGKAPGAVKVNDARTREIPLLDIQALKALLEGGGGSSVRLEDAPAAVITSYSSGYMGNGHGALLGDSYIPKVKDASTALVPATALALLTATAYAKVAPSTVPAPATAPAPAPTPAPAAATAVVARKPAAKRRKRAAVDWDDDEEFKYVPAKKRVFKAPAASEQ